MGKEGGKQLKHGIIDHALLYLYNFLKTNSLDFQYVYMKGRTYNQGSERVCAENDTKYAYF